MDDGELAQYSVHAVGDRPKSVNDDNVKAIYYRDTPTVIFCGVDGVYIKTFVNRETFERSTFYEKRNSGDKKSERGITYVGFPYYFYTLYKTWSDRNLS